eukprot:352494-Chlamydomonas_euryale.AAC.6
MSTAGVANPPPPSTPRINQPAPTPPGGTSTVQRPRSPASARLPAGCASPKPAQSAGLSCTGASAWAVPTWAGRRWTAAHARRRSGPTPAWAGLVE